MKKIGVILSGCGVQDGAEIHESVVTLLALDRLGARAVCCAPNTELDEMNHLTGKPTGAKRNVLVESARIARGDIRDIARVQASDVDGLILPGGFGAAKNLSTFATEGASCSVNGDVARLVRDCVSAGKPVAAICIAPAVLARLLGQDLKVELTIGNDPGTAAALTSMGAVHTGCPVGNIVIDEKNNVITTPAYMLAQGIAEAAEGIEKAVRAVVERA